MKSIVASVLFCLASGFVFSQSKNEQPKLSDVKQNNSSSKKKVEPEKPVPGNSSTVSGNKEGQKENSPVNKEQREPKPEFMNTLPKNE
jgi:hypothetical protein